MDISHVLYFLSVSMLLTIAPGPDILFVVAQSVAHGRRAGIMTALGLCSGVMVHTLAATAGISAILYNSAFAFQFIKYAGAIYLLYLAWQAMREGGSPLSAVAPQKQGSFALFRKGIFMNVLNPKVSLFFLAFLPQFVTPGAANAPLQMIFLGILFMVQSIFLFTLVALFAGVFAQKSLHRPGIGKYVNYGKACLYAAIGVRLAISEK